MYRAKPVANLIADALSETKSTENPNERALAAVVSPIVAALTPNGNPRSE